VFLLAIEHNFTSFCSATSFHIILFSLWRSIASHAQRAQARSAKNGSYAQATIEWTWSNRESLLLLASYTGENGVAVVARSNLPRKTATR